jgi:Smg protein
MYDILAYLFQTCQRYELSFDRELVAKKLTAAGFEDSDISEAMRWLAGVMRGPHRMVAPLPDGCSTFRAFAAKEQAKLDAACRGLLLHLEHAGILTPQTREHVIERALAASGEPLTLEQLKLIVLMVLWNEQTPSSRLVAEDLLSVAGMRVPS